MESRHDDWSRAYKPVLERMRALIEDMMPQDISRRYTELLPWATMGLTVGAIRKQIAAEFPDLNLPNLYETGHPKTITHKYVPAGLGFTAYPASGYDILPIWTLDNRKRREPTTDQALWTLDQRARGRSRNAITAGPLFATPVALKIIELVKEGKGRTSGYQDMLMKDYLRTELTHDGHTDAPSITGSLFDNGEISYELRLHRNIVQATFKTRKSRKMTFTGNTLELRGVDIPQSIITAAKGKLLAEVVGNDLFNDLSGTVTSAKTHPGGRHVFGVRQGEPIMIETDN